MNRPLTLRNDPTLQNREITARTLTIRAASVDEKTRSVEVVMATDAPVQVWDWERGIIDEVLVAEGGQFPEQLPLLANHSRWSLDDVLGSVRGAKREANAWTGRAYFAEGDENADKAWNKVRQGHLTDVSVGYRAVDFKDIAPNTTESVNGRSYTAGNRWMRITRRWEAKELSLVPIGADRDAKVREQSPGAPAPTKRRSNMDPLRKYLESLGLRSDATDEQAKAFLAALGGKQKERADAIAAGKLTLEQAVRADGAMMGEEDPEDTLEGDAREGELDEDDTVEGGDGQRSAGGRRKSRAGSSPADAGDVAQRAVTMERKRVAGIRKRAEGLGLPEKLVNRAIEEGWDDARASAEFLDHVRKSRGSSVGADAPAGIVRDHERDANTRSLGFAMAMRSGVNVEAYAKRQRIAGWENIATQADRYRGMSMLDLCREACRLDGKESPIGYRETIRAAVSGGALTSIFTTSVNASVLMAWEEVVDTTQGWVEEVDVSDFKLQTVIDVQAQSQLEKLPRGQTAKHAAASDSEITYKIARYAKQFVVDEQDIIDDRFDVLVGMPSEMGKAAARLRPDLVYSILLANGTISGGALFNSTALSTAGGHANLTTGALASGTLKTAINLMGKQYILDGTTKKVLNIKPEFLIVPQALQFTAMELLQSAGIVIAGTAGTVTERGSVNVLQNVMQLRVDERIGATGVTDPDSGTVNTGTDTNYFLASRPGRTIRVAYLRGQRTPEVRSFALDRGQWGVGWDIKMDIGAKPVDFRGLVKSTGA